MPGFSPFSPSIPHIIYTCLGGFIVLFGMFSLFLRERLYIGEACWAFAFGIAIGPYGVNIFDPKSWSNGNDYVGEVITLEFTRVVLAIGVFAAGVELPTAYMARHWRSLLFLLGPIMTWGWFISAAFIHALIPNLNFLSSLAVAACFTPTDPILAQAVIGGKYANKHVPAHIRHLLAAESGCNDGAAFPFLYIALYLVLDKTQGTAIRDWFLFLWLYQIILGITIGATIGTGFRYLIKFCEKQDLIDRHSYFAQSFALALLTIGITTILGTDDLLAAFTCGTAFAWDGSFNKQTEESVFSSVIDLLFNIAAFIYVGAWMPFSSFQDTTLSLTIWKLIVLGVLVLLFRRLPIMLMLYKWIPDVKTFREALFTGHFGPMGIGAVFISTSAAEILNQALTNHPSDQVRLLQKSIQPITAFMVLCSILIHGLSIPSFSLSRRIHTISRTWSRNASTANVLPDWTNQATIIARPDQVVVNRDSGQRVIHRNSMNSMVKGNLYTLGGGDSWSGHTFTNPSRSGSMLMLVQGDEAVNPGPAAGRDRGKRDGDVMVVEWPEEPHKVVGRRKRSGEEVVEVMEDYASVHQGSSHLSVNGLVSENEPNVLSRRTSREPTGSQISVGSKRKGAAPGVPMASHTFNETSSNSEGYQPQTQTSINDHDLRGRRRSTMPAANMRQPVGNGNDLRHYHSHHHLDGLHALQVDHHYASHRDRSPARSVRFREDSMPPLPGTSSGSSTPKYSSIFRCGFPDGRSSPLGW